MEKILLIVSVVMSLQSYGQDCSTKYFGTFSRVYLRLEEAPNHKKDKEDSFLIKGKMPVYFIEDSAKLYITGMDTFLIHSYEVRQLPFDVSITEFDKSYIFRTYSNGQYEIWINRREIVVVPASSEKRWPKLIRIYTLN